MSCGCCSSGCCSKGLVLDPPAVKQVLYGSATVVEMMSAVYSALSSSSSPHTLFPSPPSSLRPPSLALSRARSFAPVCKCVIEAKYGAVGCRRRSSRIRQEGGHPPAGGRASGSEPGERRVSWRPAPLTLRCARPWHRGPQGGGRVSPRPTWSLGTRGGRRDTGRRGQFFQVWERGGELRR